MGNRDRKVRVAQVADRQWGRVKWSQLQRLGVAKRTVSLWRRQGYLHRVLPTVYAVGHAAPSADADLAAALLYAGPGAALSHATAAWWLGLLDKQPNLIHVSTPRQCRSLAGIRVHQKRRCARIWHNRIPTTTIPQTLLDLAGTESLRTLRRVLANADYHGKLDLSAIEAELNRGRAGTAKLRHALQEHQPRLARTKSKLEVDFLELCESARLPLPEVNVRVAGWEVDALWRAQRIAVELDGYGNHRSPAQVKRDRRKELALRGAGFTPLRYGDEQLSRHRREVIADLQHMIL
jgi:predicted transcriptional regulator of viral defense system